MSDMATRILVVDDEVSITEFVGYALRKEGYEVDVFQDGEDAYAAAGCVKNPAFELYAGTPAPETEMPSGFRG